MNKLPTNVPTLPRVAWQYRFRKAPLFWCTVGVGILLFLYGLPFIVMLASFQLQYDEVGGAFRLYHADRPGKVRREQRLMFFEPLLSLYVLFAENIQWVREHYPILQIEGIRERLKNSDPEWLKQMLKLKKFEMNVRLIDGELYYEPGGVMSAYDILLEFNEVDRKKLEMALVSVNSNYPNNSYPISGGEKYFGREFPEGSQITIVRQHSDYLVWTVHATQPFLSMQMYPMGYNGNIMTIKNPQ